MKKTLILCLMAVAASFAVLGAEQKTATLERDMSSWSPFQLVFLPGFPSSSETSNVHGLKLGIPATGGSGSVYGVEASFLFSGTSYGEAKSDVRGIQGSWFGPAMSSDIYGIQGTMSFAYAKSLTGFQASAIGFLAEPSVGCQASLGGVALDKFKGFQTGAANVTVGSFHGFQFGAANVAASDMNGLQVGAVGVAKDASGVQCTLVNIITGISDAFQCGVFNYSSSKGIQLGAINIIADSWLPVMIIFNCSL